MRSTAARVGRKLLEAVLGVHPRRAGAAVRSDTLRKQLGRRRMRQPRPRSRRAATARARWRCSPPATSTATSRTSASICVRVFEHNGIEVALAPSRSSCCGMPKLELGDLRGRRAIEGAGTFRSCMAMIERGYDIVAPIPSCVLMFKQELPLMFRGRSGRRRQVKAHMFDPFEYLMLRHKAGMLRTDFAPRSARSPTTCRATCACRTSA